MNIIHLVSNKVWGGGERYALDLCKALRADGHRVEVFTRNKKAVHSVFEAEGLFKGTLPLGGALDFISPLRLASHLNKIDGDVIIHVHNFKDASTAITARRLYRGSHKVRIVGTRHLVRPAKTGALALNTIKDIDALIFVSQLAMDEFLSTAHKGFEHKMRVVHNGIAVEPRPHSPGQPGPVNLIFSGRIVPEKGLDVLVEALARLGDRDWRLSVCGTGAEKVVMPIVHRARRLGIDSRIDWKGHVDNVADELAKADIAVVPSTWREPFGLSIIEAFSQGLPVVTTDNGAQPEIMTDGVEGLLVPPSAPDALATAIGRLIDDQTLRVHLGENALAAFSRRFAYPIFYRQILDIYNEH